MHAGPNRAFALINSTDVVLCTRPSWDPAKQHSSMEEGGADDVSRSSWLLMAGYSWRESPLFPGVCPSEFASPRKKRAAHPFSWAALTGVGIK